MCKAARGGDSGAIERLLWMHHARLLGFVERRIGVDWRGRIDAEDVLQNAYVEVFAAAGQFEYRGEDSFYHWVTRIIEHRFVDQVRRLKRLKRDASREIRDADRAEGTYAGGLEGLLAALGTASAAMRRAEALAAVMAGMGRLPADYREVLTRVHVERQPIAEAASAMKRSEDAVRRLAGRALEQLREYVGNASRYWTAGDMR